MDQCLTKCIHDDKVAEAKDFLPDQKEINIMADIFKALSDPGRLKIVLALLNQELCVCDIAAVCEQSDSAISHQLRLLRTLRIVKNRRDGKIVYYSLDDDLVVSLIVQSLKQVSE